MGILERLFGRGRAKVDPALHGQGLAEIVNNTAI
jgi:hypothetical protein